MIVKTIYKWHHWTGLIVGIFLLLMSISGGLLVFTEEMQTAADHRLKEFPNPDGTYSFDASLSMVRQKYPDREIRIYDAPLKNETVVYDLRSSEKSMKLFVNPNKPEILHSVDSNTQLYRQLLLFHYTLFAGTTGKIIVVIIGILFLLSVITGIMIYRKAIWKTFNFRKGIYYENKRTFYSSLHRSIGIWTLLFNLIIIATGLVLSIQIALNALKPSVAKTAKAESAVISLDSIVQKIQKESPAFEIHMLRVKPNGNQVQISGRFQKDPLWYGFYGSYFLIDGASQKITKTQLMSEVSFGKKLLLMSVPLHFGNFGGLGLKILYFFFGLMPAVLSITGFFIWQKTRKF